MEEHLGRQHQKEWNLRRRKRDRPLSQQQGEERRDGHKRLPRESCTRKKEFFDDFFFYPYFSMVKIFTHESEHEFETSKVQFSMPAPLHNQETARVNHKSFLYHPWDLTSETLLLATYRQRVQKTLFLCSPSSRFHAHSALTGEGPYVRKNYLQTYRPYFANRRAASIKKKTHPDFALTIKGPGGLKNRIRGRDSMREPGYQGDRTGQLRRAGFRELES